ncbi:hypothetical protein YC2023_075848 [Brassica napus]
MAHRRDPHNISYFTNQCILCKKKIDPNKSDIYMYNDAPYCTEECREKQLKADGINIKDDGKQLKADKDKKKMTGEKNKK